MAVKLKHFVVCSRRGMTQARLLLLLLDLTALFCGRAFKLNGFTHLRTAYFGLVETVHSNGAGSLLR